MTYLSVCSGIEAATVAWHGLGWQPWAFSEIEKFPSAVLAHHYPTVPNHGDMTKFQEWPDADFDLLVGGTPCQSFSVAGLRRGLDDPRGNLMLTYLAIARRYAPRWIVWENVPGVLSSNDGRDFASFLHGLGELGYGWAYRVLDAQYFGLAQRRKRVFVVGYLGDWRRAAAVLFERQGLQGHPAPRREAGQGATAILEVGARTGQSTDDRRAGIGIAEAGEPMFTLQAGKQHGVLPDIANTLGAKKDGGWGGDDIDRTGAYIPVVSPAMKARDAKGASSDGDGDGLPLVVTHSLRAEGHDASEDGTGRGVPLVAFSIGSHAGAADADVSNRSHANGGPSGMGIQEEQSHTLRGGRTQVVAAPIAFSVKDHGADVGELSPTLRSGGHDKSHANGGVMPAVAFDARQSDVIQYGEQSGPLDTDGHTIAIRQAMQVRRLTPRECERLQGFPDDYTLIPYRRNKLGADGPRYKALGNSMAVPVMCWIGKRIAKVDTL